MKRFLKTKRKSKSILLVSCLIAATLTSCAKKEETQEAKIIHIGNVGEPLSLDPHQASGTWEWRIFSDTFVGLTTSSAGGEPIPGMATEWSISTDGLVWTFKLRDAKWSDGVPVTAEDFVFGFRRLFTTKPPTKYASLLFLIKNAEKLYNGEVRETELGIKAIDPKTVEIQLESPAPFLPSLLTHYVAAPIPKHTVEKFGKDWIKPENIVSNGPYEIAEWIPGDYVHAVKNDYFYDARNVCFSETYYYPTQDDTAAERRVRTGKLDVQANFSGNRLEEIEKTLPGYSRISDFAAITYYLFNLKNPKFQDARVREALSLAINREFIADQILRGGQKPAYSLVPPELGNYVSGKASLDWKQANHNQKLERARKLLMEAGFGPDKPLSFTFNYRNSGDNPKIAPVVQQNWRDIAPWVHVEIIGMDVQVHYEKLRQGDFEVGDGGWAADFEDARSFLYNFTTSAGEMNYAKYSNSEFDKLMKEADNERDGQKRIETLEKAEQITLNDDALVPVYFYSSRALVNPKIMGWIENSLNYHPTRFLCMK